MSRLVDATASPCSVPHKIALSWRRGSEVCPADSDDNDDTNTMYLRDISRPLQSWGISLLGKVQLGYPNHIDGKPPM